MNKREELHYLLVSILGSSNVYFQPPASKKMAYPCIVYAREEEKKTHANDLPYTTREGYSITLIDANPDSEFFEKISALPLCRYDRPYTANNLNHDVFTIYP